MIFKIHYFLFNMGIAGVLIFITVYARKYTDATSTEVGALIMTLAIMSVVTKPFFCALADRHQRYRLYFILAMAICLAGFGSYVFLPFFPDFTAHNGRIAWYLMILMTVIGQLAFGVVWSLGDAYAANVSHRTGESFGNIRLWGTIGWGVSGGLVGVASPHFHLPEMVLGLLVFIATQVLEIILLCWWPNEQDFKMGDPEPINLPLKDVVKQPSIDGINFNKPATIKTKEAHEGKGSLVSVANLASQELGPMDSKPKMLEDKLDNTINNIIVKSKKARMDLEAHADRQRISELQMTIFRMIVIKHKSIFKYLILFVILGITFNIHWSYFFLHMERLATEGKGEFSTLVSFCLVAQAVGETLCFIIAPYVVRKIGRNGAISLNLIAYAGRYFGNGLGIPLISPHVAVITELLQGINYGIFYFLVTDTALHYALMVDEVIPELVERQLIRPQTDMNAVRVSLRATMQGIFSGAFDGLGFGLGSLIAGMVLERHSYEELWCYTGTAALLLFFLHAIYETCFSGRWYPKEVVVVKEPSLDSAFGDTDPSWANEVR